MEDEIEQEQVDALTDALKQENPVGNDGISAKDKGKAFILNAYVAVILSVGTLFGFKAIIQEMLRRPIELKEIEVQAEREQALIDAILTVDSEARSNAMKRAMSAGKDPESSGWEQLSP